MLLVLIFELLRRRQLREKYAVLWMAVGLLTLPFGLVPDSLNATASHLGVASGASLVLFLAVVFLLLVCIHLCWEASRLEDETRALAEEVALIRTELRDLRAQTPDGVRGAGVRQAHAQPATAEGTASSSKPRSGAEVIAPRRGDATGLGVVDSSSVEGGAHR
jgi:hypothetical protein